jgi:zinc-ribbon domain
MRLFGRKRSDGQMDEPCPHCGEPVPEGAVECMMCGVDLKPLRGAPSGELMDPSRDGFPCALTSVVNACQTLPPAFGVRGPRPSASASPGLRRPHPPAFGVRIRSCGKYDPLSLPGILARSRALLSRGSGDLGEREAVDAVRVVRGERVVQMRAG